METPEASVSQGLEDVLHEHEEMQVVTGTRHAAQPGLTATSHS